MSRRRYISTKLSLDARVNRLATTAGDFAALLYTWMIPHAEDDGCLSGDPEELLMQVMPGRRDKSVEDVAGALGAMADLGLISWERGVQVAFPTATFYAYQSYVPADKRRPAPPDDTPNPNGRTRAAKQRETPQNAADTRRAPQNSVSPSLSPSPVPTPSPSPSPALSPERERETPDLNGSRVRQPAHGSLSLSPAKQPTTEPDSREPPPNTDARLYDALVTAIGQAPTTRAAKAEWGAWLRQLAEARASPAQIAERCLIYRRRFGPEIPLTPRALVRQWDQLTQGSPGGAANHATTTLAAATADVESQRRAERERQAEEKRRLAKEILGDLNTWPGRGGASSPTRASQTAANGYGAGTAGG